jgi:LacI family transcriptional regulator
MPKNRVTMKDVAKAVGVHVSTVSRALDAKASGRISPEVAAKVRAAARKLRFRPNAAGYSLRTNRSRLVGIVVPDITDPIFPPIIRGFEDGLREHGYAALLANTDNEAGKEAEIVAAMLARSVDGLALASVKYHDKLIRTIGDVPVVTVGRETERPLAPRVIYDEDDGMRRILSHLVSLGHRRVAAIAGPQDVSTGRSRYEAFERYRREMKLSLDKRLVAFAGAFNETEGERCAEKLAASASNFTAIVCANDRLAIGAIAVLRRRGMRCPDDVSVTGVNDMPYVARLVPALTTVRVQQYRAGHESAKLLVEAIEAPPASRAMLARTVLPVELVVRDSTQAIAALDEVELERA